MGAWQTYRSLSAEQREILSKKQLELDRPVDELIALLKPIAACDKVANKSQTRFGCTFGVLIVMTVVAVILFSNLGRGPLLLGTFALFVAAAVACGWFWIWLRGIDVSNNLRSFVIPVLALFREDIGPKSPVRLRLDLRKPTDATKKAGESAPYKQGVYHKIIDTTYVDPWMTAETVLTDGTKLWWSVTDRIRERKKTKRNPRGKYKTKTKYRKITELEVRLGMKTKTYELAKAVDAEVTSDGKRNKVDLQRRVRSASLEPIDPRALVDAITSVYRAARPAKKEASA
jgi:hypothetical protein